MANRSRAAALCSLGLVVMSCARRPAPPTVPAFEARWRAASRAAEVIQVGDERGGSLMGNVRRTAHPKLIAPAGATLPVQPPGDEISEVIRSNLAGVKGCYQIAAR